MQKIEGAPKRPEQKDAQCPPARVVPVPAVIFRTLTLETHATRAGARVIVSLTRIDVVRRGARRPLLRPVEPGGRRRLGHYEGRPIRAHSSILVLSAQQIPDFR